MRVPSASIDSPPVPGSSRSAFPDLDLDLAIAAWADPAPGSGLPARPDKAKSVGAVMLALGAAVLVFVPVAGVLFLIAGGLGLAIASEATTVPAAPKKGILPGC